jgi:hypothetical protein
LLIEIEIKKRNFLGLTLLTTNPLFFLEYLVIILNILYFSILLHSFYTEYLFFCPSMYQSLFIIYYSSTWCWSTIYLIVFTLAAYIDTWKWPCEAETCRRIINNKKWMLHWWTKEQILSLVIIVNSRYSIVTTLVQSTIYNYN